MIEDLVDLASRVAELERRVAGTMRHGTVSEVEPGKWVRLKIGTSDEGGDFLSPKIPYAQVAGAMKVHSPPSVGQQMTLLAPSGDWRQSVALPFTWSDDNPTPNESGEEHELTFGNVRVLLRDGEAVLSVGGSSITLTDGQVTIRSSKVLTDGPTYLNNGSKKVHRIDDIDSNGDSAVTGADNVFA